MTMESNSFFVHASVRNNVYSVIFMNKKNKMFFGIMSKNPDKIKEWLKNRLTK